MPGKWFIIALVVAGCCLAVLSPAFSQDSNQISMDTRTIDKLIIGLKSPSPKNRYIAAHTLADLGSFAALAVPALTKALNDTDGSVRACVAFALGQIGPPAASAVPALTKALNDKITTVRSAAVISLGQLGSLAVRAVPEVANALKDSDHNVRRRAALALGAIGSAAFPAVPSLVEALNKDKDPSVRESAAHALADLGPSASSAVPALTKALTDRDRAVQRRAAYALGRIGPPAASAVPALTTALHDTDSNVRSLAAYALGRIGTAAAAATIPALIELLKDNDRDVRSCAAFALGAMGPSGATAMPALAQLLKDNDNKVRFSAAQALGSMGPSAATAVPALTQLLKDNDSQVRGAAIQAMETIDGSLQERVRFLKSGSLNAAVDAFNSAMKTLADMSKDKSLDHDVSATALGSVEGTLAVLQREYDRRHRFDIPKSLRDHLPLAIGIGFLLLCWAGSSLLLFVSPLTLLRINDGLKYMTGLPLPEPLKSIGLAPAYLLGAGFLYYHPRVLDAWVKKHATTTLDRLKRRPTFSERSVYVDIKIGFPEGDIRPTPAAFHDCFARNRAVIVLSGDGGSGKTTLACQLARWALEPDEDGRLCKTHRMLPIFIEESLPGAKSGESGSLLSVIRGQLGELIGEDQAPAEDLVKNLLLLRRVLVIVDGLSELDEATRQVIRPDNPSLPLNALIVTSRRDDEFKNHRDLCLTTGLLKEQDIAAFVADYLRQSGSDETLKNAALYSELNHFTSMVGDREITALLAGLYARNMIERSKDHMVAQPNNVPDLMYAYVDAMCRKADDRTYPADICRPRARIIAWYYLKQALRPIEINAIDLAEAMPTAENDIVLQKGPLEWKAVLDAFVDPLRLMKRGETDREAIKFTLDPLAEYLAAHYQVKGGGLHDAEAWKNFLDEVKKKHTSRQSIKGFLLALYDTIDTKSESDTQRDFLLTELRKRFPDVWPSVGKVAAPAPPDDPEHAVVNLVNPSSVETSAPGTP